MMCELVPAVDDRLDAVRVSFRDAAGNEECCPDSVPLQELEDQRDGHFGAVGPLRQDPRSIGVGSVLRDPHLFGVEVERERRRCALSCGPHVSTTSTLIAILLRSRIDKPVDRRATLRHVTTVAGPYLV